MRILALSLFIIIFLSFSGNAFAQQIGLPRVQPDGRGSRITGSAGDDLGTLIKNTVTLFFSIGGIGFTIMILWGTVNWILSGGDKEKIAGARKRITTAIVGLVLLSLTFVIIFVLGQILGLESLYTGDFKVPGLLK
jgi:hypothetical protein